MRILLIEDDNLIGSGIKMGLPRHGFSIDWFKDGKTGLDALFSAKYDAVILDLTLPGMDGLAILREWRGSGQMVPVLVLTARDELSQRVEGLNLGADDYLGKPFDLEELAARLHALIRRSHGTATQSVSHGKISMNITDRSVFIDGEHVNLTQREAMLVELLLLNPKNVLSRSAIEEKIYPWGEEVSSNSVEVLIHRVRRKLGSSFVKTVHSIGYALGSPE